MELKEIAVIHTDFPEKFGIPRQSGLVGGLQGTIVFSPEYRNADAIRGLTDFSHLWLVWGFSKAKKDHWSATVRPPRLGGKVRMGIFATRSPFRPNPIGLSSVKLESVTMDEKFGPIITVSGIDMLDGTPIYDIKPYLPYTDSHPEATGGWTPARRAPAALPPFWGLPPLAFRPASAAAASQSCSSGVYPPGAGRARGVPALTSRAMKWPSPP